MRVDHASKRVFVRQSWLNDMAICPERARLGAAHPEFRMNTDATNMGTALHAGIEIALEGGDRDAMWSKVTETYGELAAKPFRVTNVNPDAIGGFMDAMTTSFYEGILPQVQLGGKAELRFASPLGITLRDDYAVWLEGTMDYVDPSGVIWDWKTASRAYNAKEKQKSSIQASVYAAAATRLGMSEYPVDFRYGVMQRTLAVKSQVVSLVRTEAHDRWLQRFVTGAVNTAASNQIGPWFMNDSSNLCSEAWCPYWSLCKGAFLTEDDMRVPEGVIVPAE